MAGEGGIDAKPDEVKPSGRKALEKWLNKSMKIEMTDGRTLIGVFVCTDKDKNVILGSCEEYLKPLDSGEKEEPRILGLAMIPGHHIVSIMVDEDQMREPQVM
ncbi:N-alpha-acetyltransferase 38-A, NatC auxiliary subunit-like [Liolophura sinensis]|uniref:N-alpha-acetyltransferase 38-A, NatC auxiliary subunit-like n=1 Tax=Liolophura sinensis TaxID=3198878 RepID=UPI00315934D5